MKTPGSGLRIDSPSWPLLQGLISYWGITDANGNAGGTTILCADKANHPSYDGLTVKILTGPAAGQARTISVDAGGVITVAVGFTNPAGAAQQITLGTLFVILTSMAGGGGPGPAPEEGLFYYGIVDTAAAPQFTISALAGLGAGKFNGPTNPYYAFVFRKGTGTGLAPQGEQQAVTAYATATGAFTTAAFTAPVAIGDEILIIHPSLAAALVVLAGLGVPPIDSLINLLMRDVVGNKADTPITTSDLVSSLIRYAKGNLNATGLVYKGTVTNWVNATQFAALGLAGFGDQAFANGQYFIFAFRDAGGAAAMPQSEFRVLQTYTSATGTFTHEAFSVDLANDDIVIIIHQSLLFPGAVSGYGAFDTSSTTVPADSTRAARYPWEVADQFKGMLLMPIMGGCRFIPRRIVGFTVAGGIFTLDPNNPFPALPGNSEYLILADQTEFVPAANSTNNGMPSDVIGNKTDTGITASTNTASIIRYLKGIMDSLLSYEGATALANKLTAARAALLDRLSIITAGGAGELTAARAAVLQRLIDDLTATRAGYLDNLIGVVTSGTFSLVNNILEQDALIVAAGTRVVDIELDMNNLTQINTVREYVQVDGANYRQISAKAFPTVFDTGTKCVTLSFVQKGTLYKVTLQASVLEGAAKDVPWRRITKDLI